ncbi:hypothetical protein Vadar_010578 [Vaccinium darrowii]|uniref:Uncharacterized protein n=1 Tax=Vaccinium darrowii TaxID=229202 RepID=A0ACB7YKT2_9ERIC|nr:hypothetical protein Vadar_010578 [Vaccinium darrowii]
METEINGFSSPISCDVLDSARDECRSRRKLEFEDDDDFLNMDVPIEVEGEQDECHNSVHAIGNINLVHSKISNEAIPKLDMKFMTEEVAYQFYNAYAYKVGFSVRRSKEHKDKSGRLVDNRRYEELNADFKANQSTPYLSFPVQILKHAASIYTPDVFVLFQKELSKAHDCCLKQCGENGTITKYEITPFHKQMVSCSCKKFEFGGILCSHALKVLSSNNIVKIPNQYILKRWTKNAKSGSIDSTCARTPVEDPKAMMGIRYKDLCRLCTQLETRAAEIEDAYKIALNALKKIAEEVDASLIGETFQGISHANIIASQDINEATYGEGSKKKAKGLKIKKRTTKSSKRPRSALERAIQSKRALVRSNLNSMKNPVQQSEIHPSSCISQL